MALPDQCVECLKCLDYRRLCIETVALVEIDLLQLQAPETRFHLIKDMSP